MSHKNGKVYRMSHSNVGGLTLNGKIDTLVPNLNGKIATLVPSQGNNSPLTLLVKTKQKNIPKHNKHQQHLSWFSLKFSIF